jgi:copper chaperone
LSKMQTMKFKTNVNCANCVDKLSTYLNPIVGIYKWEIDLTDPAKVLTVEAKSLSADEIKAVVKLAGFQAERLQ